MDKQKNFEEKFDKKINKQNTQITEILTLLKEHEPKIEQKNKGQNKTKKSK
jgi:hypothetical protein